MKRISKNMKEFSFRMSREELNSKTLLIDCDDHTIDELEVYFDGERLLCYAVSGNQEFGHIIDPVDYADAKEQYEEGKTDAMNLILDMQRIFKNLKRSGRA
jgi:hypothetical protein